MQGALGSDGSLPPDRIARYCNINEAWAETTIFCAVTPLEVLYQAIVNDGQPGKRGFRKTLFSPNLRYCGIAGEIHEDKMTVVSLVYVKGILERGQQQKINVTVTEEVPRELL